MFVSRFCTAVIMFMLITLAPVMAYSGSLDSPASPTGTSSAMYTLTDIYNRLDTGTATAKRTDAFTEPTDGPGTATGYTLDEIMAIAPAKDDTDGASASHVLSGKTFWGLTIAGWGTQTGSIVDREGDNASTARAAAGGVNYLTAPAGYYDGGDRVSATDAQIVALDTDLATGNIKSGVTVFGIVGNENVVDTTSGDAVAGEILSGKKAYVGGILVTGIMADKEGDNASTAQAAASEVNYLTAPTGYYDGDDRVSATDAQIAALDTDLAAANVISGKTIFGIVGSASSGSSAGVPKTGQTISYATGDDGNLQKGVAWPDPRFTDNGDDVTDNLTGLIWLKNANAPGAKNWADALTYCNDLTAGGSSDWRLPNMKELLSLIHYGVYSPALPSDHPFSGVQSGPYWSGTTYSNVTSYAWGVYLFDGNVYYGPKTNTFDVWPVRAGQ